MPRLSIVISVFNKEKYIAKTLQSVLDQTFQDFEIVILNDGSTDNSEQEILKFKDSRIRYFSEENQGAAAGRNYVIKKAQGEYIALLDADDWWYPNHLTQIIYSINKFPEESVFANGYEISTKNKTQKANYSFDAKVNELQVLNYFEASMDSSVLHSSNFAIKATIFTTLGYYNTAYKTGEDTDFYVRLGLHYNVVFNPENTVRYFLIEDGLNFTNRTLEGKAIFEEYEIFENGNLALKRFLDINRFSLCVIAKLEGNTKGFEKLKRKINIQNLNSKQRFILKQPKLIIKVMINIKKRLNENGLNLSAFKQ